MRHDLFGSFAADPFEQLIEAQIAADTAAITPAITPTNIDDYLTGRIALPCRAAGPVHPKPEAPAPYRGRVFADHLGTWDEQPTGTLPGSGDNIDAEGVVWRLRPSDKLRGSTPRHIYDRAVTVTAAAREKVEALVAELGPDHPSLARPREILKALEADRSRKLKAFLAWQERGEDPEIWTLAGIGGRERDWRRIDAVRMTDAGRADRNASRRTTGRGPNARLAGMTAAEREAHRRKQKAEAESNRRQRAKENAEAAQVSA